MSNLKYTPSNAILAVHLTPPPGPLNSKRVVLISTSIDEDVKPECFTGLQGSPRDPRVWLSGGRGQTWKEDPPRPVSSAFALQMCYLKPLRTEYSRF